MNATRWNEMRWFTGVFGERPPSRIFLEASPERYLDVRHLESLGHEVIVADPNDAPGYANRSRRTKSNKRDARTLMEVRFNGSGSRGQSR